MKTADINATAKEIAAGFDTSKFAFVSGRVRRSIVVAETFNLYANCTTTFSGTTMIDSEDVRAIAAKAMKIICPIEGYWD